MNLMRLDDELNKAEKNELNELSSTIENFQNLHEEIYKFSLQRQKNKIIKIKDFLLSFYFLDPFTK